jgi:hypothetical protein
MKKRMGDVARRLEIISVIVTSAIRNHRLPWRDLNKSRREEEYHIVLLHLNRATMRPSKSRVNDDRDYFKAAVPVAVREDKYGSNAALFRHFKPLRSRFALLSISALGNVLNIAKLHLGSSLSPDRSVPTIQPSVFGAIRFKKPSL